MQPTREARSGFSTSSYFSQLSNNRIAAEEFQVWNLADRPERTATLTCEDGNIKRSRYPTARVHRFPAPEVMLWFANNVIYLPKRTLRTSQQVGALRLAIAAGPCQV